MGFDAGSSHYLNSFDVCNGHETMTFKMIYQDFESNIKHKISLIQNESIYQRSNLSSLRVSAA